MLRGDAAEIVPRHLQVGSLPGALDMERKKTAHGRYLVSNEFQESYHHSNIFDKYDESREIIADICIYSLGQGI